jgi:Spy/CpxP family protein refolding chaperone
MKKVGKVPLLLAVALVMSLGLAASSWAQPAGKGKIVKNRFQGHGMMNLTPEEAGKLFDLKEKFHNDTAALRKQMWVQRAEMAALWKAEKPDEKAILAKQKELSAVRDQLQQKMVTFRLEARKIAPNCGRGWHGMGHGMGIGGDCGMGPGGWGMGPGMMPPPPPESTPPPPPAK